MTVAFVLSGGASLGAVEVGMVRALQRHGVTPDVLFGTSVGAVNAAYLSTLAIGGGMTRSMLVEFQTAGPSAQAMRRDVFDRYVRLMRGVCDALRADEPSLNAVQPGLALAVVGGVDEIVVRAIESDGVEAIAALGDIATGLWAAVLTGAVVPARAR